MEGEVEMIRFAGLLTVLPAQSRDDGGKTTQRLRNITENILEVTPSMKNT
jgi:hypothetical protein